MAFNVFEIGKCFSFFVYIDREYFTIKPIVFIDSTSENAINREKIVKKSSMDRVIVYTSYNQKNKLS